MKKPVRPSPSWPSGWSVSDTGREVIFTLEPDISFHDGSELTADVVVENFQRWATADQLLGSQFDDVGRLPFSIILAGLAPRRPAC